MTLYSNLYTEVEAMQINDLEDGLRFISWYWKKLCIKPELVSIDFNSKPDQKHCLIIIIFSGNEQKSWSFKKGDYAVIKKENMEVWSEEDFLNNFRHINKTA